MTNSMRAGVIFKLKFTTPTEKSYKRFIDYINREAAIHNPVHSPSDAPKNKTYGDYHTYMGNPEKSTGLFSAYSNSLSRKEQSELKQAFLTAEQNNSPMWQGVFSFENPWLAQNGLYNLNTEELNEQKLQEAVRLSVAKLFEKENLTGTATWCAAIHFNTDNIHVHLAFVEPVPTRVQTTNPKTGKLEFRGKIKNSSMEAAKSVMVNEIINQREITIRINELMRTSILGKRKQQHLIEDRQFSKVVLELYNNLPEERWKWNYNCSSMVLLHPLIDKITDQYLEMYHKDSLDEMKSLIMHQEELYAAAYGQRKNGQGIERWQHKMDDLHVRLGNVLLHELREMDKIMKEEYYRHTHTTVTQPWQHYQARAAPKLLKGNYLGKLKNALGKSFDEHYQNLRAYNELDEDLDFHNVDIEGGI